MSEIVLEDTDTITVVYGQGEPIAEYANHPRVQWVAVNGRTPPELINAIAPTSKFIVLGERIYQQLYQHIHAESKRRRGQMLHKGNTGAIRTMLRTIFPEPAPELTPPVEIAPPLNRPANPPEKKPKRERGFVQAFLDAHPFDATKTASDEGRRLFQIAQAKGLTTTLASLTQAILVRKQKAHTEARPKPEPWGKPPLKRTVAKPRVTVTPARRTTAIKHAASSVKLLDDAVRALQALRTWAIEIQEENAELRAQTEAIKKLKQQLGW
jgi:hypothetical protein